MPYSMWIEGSRYHSYWMDHPHPSLMVWSNRDESGGGCRLSNRCYDVAECEAIVAAGDAEPELLEIMREFLDDVAEESA